MRWTKKEGPKLNDSVIIKKFLWFPKTIGLETRWLERAAFISIFEYEYTDIVFGECYDFVPKKFLTEEEWK